VQLMKPMPDQGGLFIVFYSWLNGKLEILSDLRQVGDTQL